MINEEALSALTKEEIMLKLSALTKEIMLKNEYFNLEFSLNNV